MQCEEWCEVAIMMRMAWLARGGQSSAQGEAWPSTRTQTRLCYSILCLSPLLSGQSSTPTIVRMREHMQE